MKKFISLFKKTTVLAGVLIIFFTLGNPKINTAQAATEAAAAEPYAEFEVKALTEGTALGKFIEFVVKVLAKGGSALGNLAEYAIKVLSEGKKDEDFADFSIKLLTDGIPKPKTGSANYAIKIVTDGKEPDPAWNMLHWYAPYGKKSPKNDQDKWLRGGKAKATVEEGKRIEFLVLTTKKGLDKGEKCEDKIGAGAVCCSEEAEDLPMTTSKPKKKPAAGEEASAKKARPRIETEEEPEIEQKCTSQDYPGVEGLCRLGETCEPETIMPEDECWALMKGVAVCCASKEAIEGGIENKIINSVIETIKEWENKNLRSINWENTEDLFAVEGGINAVPRIDIAYTAGNRPLFSIEEVRGFGLTSQKVVNILMNNMKKIRKTAREIQMTEDNKKIVDAAEAKLKTIENLDWPEDDFFQVSGDEIEVERTGFSPDANLFENTMQEFKRPGDFVLILLQEYKEEIKNKVQGQ